MNYEDLNNLKETIEKLSKFNQIEILKIFHKNPNININENKYGCHINLSEVDSDSINEVKNYIQYVNTQENDLNSMEEKKEKCKKYLNTVG